MQRLSSLGLAVAFGLTLAGCGARAAEGPPPVAGYYGPPPNGALPPPSGFAPPTQPSPFETGEASFYADRLSGHATASGEPYDPSALTAAHRTLPLGTIVDVVRGDGRVVRVRVNDRGPYADGRVLDLSKEAARQLGMLKDGVASVALWLVFVPPPKAKRHARR